ncbi:hypothetical protein DSOUD_3327 [Desulfuromonas soudanensis]|uniref:Uncharacterized protein n=2 Tax=Desulfuromonas soudanensis TaxID=1603606 RepID=A0A0M4D9A7_9BACT|nr:hypothetical protein DSOUD_3327 [Desulfuromonas soudanensis]
MGYLSPRGFAARYLTDALLVLMENLRGEDARYLLKECLPSLSK